MTTILNSYLFEDTTTMMAKLFVELLNPYDTLSSFEYKLELLKIQNNVLANALYDLKTVERQQYMITILEKVKTMLENSSDLKKKSLVIDCDFIINSLKHKIQAASEWKTICNFTAIGVSLGSIGLSIGFYIIKKYYLT